MKNYTLIYITSIAAIFSIHESHAQLVNQGALKVNDATIVSVYFDYKNAAEGNFVNDGEVHIFENWENEGIVSFNSPLDGKTYFEGTTEQIIEGAKVSNFQNIIFDNIAIPVPFHLASTITVGKMAEFKKGIINASDYNGLVIFKENAFHSNASSQSFVDGQTENNVDEPFEFPVGDAQYFRPAFYASNSTENSIYTSQYFYENSATLYSHNNKEESIISINDTEYWQIIQNQGSEKIVLSLTLDTATTSAVFFNENPETEVAIVRWSEADSKWINEGGVLTDANAGEEYEKILTAQVTGYGIFTMAVVKKSNPGPSDLIIYNAISPNGDQYNDKFHIKGIDKYPDNTVEIYNRWGVKVYQAKSYNETTVMFNGYSDGRTTVDRNEKLPAGTYFYILNYNNGAEIIKKIGYLYVDNQ